MAAPWGALTVLGCYRQWDGLGSPQTRGSAVHATLTRYSMLLVTICDQWSRSIALTTNTGFD